MYQFNLYTIFNCSPSYAQKLSHRCLTFIHTECFMNNIYSKQFNSTSNYAKDVLYYLLLLHYQIQVFRCLIDTIISYLVLPLTLFIVPFGSKTFNGVHLHVDHTFKLCLLSFLGESLGDRTINFHEKIKETVSILVWVLKYVQIWIPNAFIQKKIQQARDTPTRLNPMIDFHSPVGAFISEKVWPKDARYRAFFSSMVSLLQSPFSLSFRTQNVNKLSKI